MLVGRTQIVGGYYDILEAAFERILLGFFCDDSVQGYHIERIQIVSIESKSDEVGMHSHV